MKRVYLKVLTAIAVAAAVTACGTNKKEVKVEETSKVAVYAELSTEDDIEQIAEFTGNIEPFQKNNISASMSVRIDKILVDVGSKVSKGQLLVTMDKTQYNQSAVQLANLEVDYARLKSVYDAGGVSKQQLDQAHTQLVVTREATNNLKENIELRSPINGVVTGRYYDAGDMFSLSPNASGASGVLTVMQINPLKVIIDVSEQYFTAVKSGMGVDIKVDLFPDKVFNGKVTLIYPAINTDTRTFTVEVSIPNPDNELRPGMFSRTTLNFGKVRGVMVNDLAIQKQIGTNEKYLFVVKGDKVERRIVKTGRTIGNFTNILSGVEPGEQIVVSGISKLADGTEVEIKTN